MTILKCCNCNQHFDEEEADYRRECVGEFWGTLAYQDIKVCPYCGSFDYEEKTYPYEECMEQEDCDGYCDECKFYLKKEVEQ